MKRVTSACPLDGDTDSPPLGGRRTYIRMDDSVWAGNVTEKIVGEGEAPGDETGVDDSAAAAASAAANTFVSYCIVSVAASDAEYA